MLYINDMKNFKSMVIDLIALDYGKNDPELELWYSALMKNPTEYRKDKANLDKTVYDCEVPAQVLMNRYGRIYYDVLLRNPTSRGRLFATAQ